MFILGGHRIQRSGLAIRPPTGSYFFLQLYLELYNYNVKTTWAKSSTKVVFRFVSFVEDVYLIVLREGCRLYVRSALYEDITLVITVIMLFTVVCFGEINIWQHRLSYYIMIIIHTCTLTCLDMETMEISDVGMAFWTEQLESPM